jgi:hypothetical protein
MLLPSDPVLLEFIPRMVRVAILWDSSNPGMALRVKETQAAASQAKLMMHDARGPDLRRCRRFDVVRPERHRQLPARAPPMWTRS